jgi:N-acyl homoserine lactone hydrolase
MKLWRLDGGQFRTPLNAFSDTLDYPGECATLTNSCYLIDHNNGVMLFDTGFPASMSEPLDPLNGVTSMAGVPIYQQLADVGFSPADVNILALSHHHLDHTGQAELFPQARLLLGRQDIDALRARHAPFYSEPGRLSRWLSGTGRMDPVDGDWDIFGDGAAVMLALPGHTPGHHGLLVRLPDTGPVLLSADTVHFAAQLVGRVPSFNTSRAESLASIDRVRNLVTNLNAKLISSHDPQDIAKLPAYPAFAS